MIFRCLQEQKIHLMYIIYIIYKCILQMYISKFYLKFWWFSGSRTQYEKYGSIRIDHKVYLGFWNIQEVSKLRFNSVLCCKRTAVIIWVIISLSNGCYWEAPRVSWATEHRGKSRYPNYCNTPLPSVAHHRAHARLICAPSGKTLFT